MNKTIRAVVLNLLNKSRECSETGNQGPAVTLLESAINVLEASEEIEQQDPPVIENRRQIPQDQGNGYGSDAQDAAPAAEATGDSW